MKLNYLFSILFEIHKTFDLQININEKQQNKYKKTS